MSLIPQRSFFDTDRFFGDFFTPARREPEDSGSFFAPRIDIKELKDHYEISAELPGVNKDDIHVDLNHGVLTLEAETKQENIEKSEGRVIRQERRFGKFVRSFNLGADVHENDITASFSDGVLTLNAPKSSHEEPASHRIEVK